MEGVVEARLVLGQVGWRRSVGIGRGGSRYGSRLWHFVQWSGVRVEPEPKRVYWYCESKFHEAGLIDRRKTEGEEERERKENSESYSCHVADME